MIIFASYQQGKNEAVVYLSDTLVPRYELRQLLNKMDVGIYLLEDKDPDCACYKDELFGYEVFCHPTLMLGREQKVEDLRKLEKDFENKDMAFVSIRYNDEIIENNFAQISDLTEHNWTCQLDNTYDVLLDMSLVDYGVV